MFCKLHSACTHIQIKWRCALWQKQNSRWKEVRVWICSTWVCITRKPMFTVDKVKHISISGEMSCCATGMAFSTSHFDVSCDMYITVTVSHTKTSYSWHNSLEEDQCSSRVSVPDDHPWVVRCSGKQSTIGWEITRRHVIAVSTKAMSD